MPESKPLIEVRESLDEMTAAMSRFLVENFESVEDEVRQYDAYRLLKYLRDHLLGKFVEHVRKVTYLESRDAESLARTLIFMALQIRNSASHFNASRDHMRLAAPLGAISAIGCLLSLTRVFGLNDSSPEIEKINERLNHLIELYSTQNPVDAQTRERNRRRRPSPDTFVARKASSSGFELLVLSTPHKNRRIHLDDDLLPVILGRNADDAEARIVDLSEYVATPDYISRLHCEISIHGSAIYVRDLGTTNGTFLNAQGIHIGPGIPGQPHLFKADDVLCLGDVVELRLIRKEK